jgi:8-oxo-dGTP diphosphatase
LIADEVGDPTGAMNDEIIEKYFNLGVSVTVVLYGFEDGKLRIFTQKIRKNPYAGAWSLPGKLIRPDESLKDASEDIVMEAIGNKDIYLEQLNAFGKIYRHPLGRVIDVSFYGLLNMREDIKATREDKETKWVHVDEIPQLAYDHNEILELALQRLRRRLVNRPIGFKLLPKEFTLTELQQLYEEILGRPLDKRNFRKKLTKLNVLIAKGHEETANPGRKPRLFMFNEENYNLYLEQGF